MFSEWNFGGCSKAPWSGPKPVVTSFNKEFQKGSAMGEPTPQAGDIKQSLGFFFPLPPPPPPPQHTRNDISSLMDHKRWHAKMGMGCWSQCVERAVCLWICKEIKSTKKRKCGGGIGIGTIKAGSCKTWGVNFFFLRGGTISQKIPNSATPGFFQVRFGIVQNGASYRKNGKRTTVVNVFFGHISQWKPQLFIQRRR